MKECAEAITIILFQTCSTTTIWTYGRITSRQLDYSHIDSTRNLNTRLFKDKFKEPLCKLLCSLESQLRDSQRMGSAATAMPSVQDNDDENVRNIIDSERGRILKWYRTTKVEKWLKNELAKNEKHKLLSTQEKVKTKIIHPTWDDGAKDSCQEPKFVCAVEVVRSRAFEQSLIWFTICFLAP